MEREKEKVFYIKIVVWKLKMKSKKCPHVQKYHVCPILHRL